MNRWKAAVLGFVVLGAGIQVVPYGRDKRNPPVQAEPAWDSARTRELFSRACKDCHSNETVWPWYSAIAPASWLIYRDVSEGRSHFNVSERGGAQEHGGDAAEMVRKGEMPPWQYRPAHPEAWLSEAEAAALIAGLDRTFGDESAMDEEASSPGEVHSHDHAH